MAIKRVLLPVSGERSFEPLADAAFYMGEKFSAQVMGLFVQAPALVIPWLDDFVSVAEVGHHCRDRPRKTTGSSRESDFDVQGCRRTLSTCGICLPLGHW